MEACIITINSGHDKYMGYAYRNKIGDKSLKGGSIPVFMTSYNYLMGVTGDSSLLIDMKLNPVNLIKTGTIENNLKIIRQHFIHEYKKESGILILTTNNLVFETDFNFDLVNVYSEFQEPYLAIGKGSDIALGALYGLDSSRSSPKDKMEITLRTVTKFYPELNNVGYLNI